MKEITRRDFLEGTARGAAAIALGAPGLIRAAGGGETSTRVVLVRDPDAVGAGRMPNDEVIVRMLDDGVIGLTGAGDAEEAWASILGRGDGLGIKSNVWPDLPTPPALERTIRERAVAAGVASRSISVNDRGLLQDPVFAKTDRLVNVRPLRTHHWSGIGGCIKNYIMFHPEPWTWHDDSCADLGGLWKLDACRGKTRLNVLVLLTPLFHGIGPHHFDPEHVWNYGGLLVGSDPVALDALGVLLLDAKRKAFFDTPPRGGTSTKHVRLADTRHGIGTADPEKMEIVRIGPMEDALI